ncbi:unnamed protein product [Caenorhabditis nigoni]
MNEAVIKEEVIEEELNFTFKNGEYVEVKQEEVEQKPEHLLEKEVKMKPIDFPENVELKTKEEEIEMVSEEITDSERVCDICQKIMPSNLLKWIKSEEEKIVLSKIFKVALFLKTNKIYVCTSHIQMIIDGYDGKWKSPKTRYELLLRSFVRRNKYQIKNGRSQKRYCHVCCMSKNGSEFYEVSSKNIRMVLMIGCSCN